MFSTINSDVTSFRSTWKKSRHKEEMKMQTETYKIVHRGLNVKKHRDKECQTDDYLYVEEDIIADIDEADLSSFINNVLPSIEKALLCNEQSKLFKLTKFEDSNMDSNKCLYTLKRTNMEDNSARSIIGISWASNGFVFAAAFGEMSHIEWCNHVYTGVGIYSLSTLDKLQLKRSASKSGNDDISPIQPDIFLETNSCVSSVVFHVNLPGIIAAGTQNGAIVIWDWTKTVNNQLIASTFTQRIHEDSVVSLRWLNSSNKSTSSTTLLSMSNDGLIIVWNLHLAKQSITPINCWKFSLNDLPKSVRHNVSGSKTKSINSLSTTSADVNPHNNTQAVVGIDVGVVFLCRLKTKNTASFDFENPIKKFKSPMETVLASSIGYVHSVKWSHHIPNQIGVASADGLLYLYNSESRQLVVSIDTNQGYLYDLDISSHLHSVIATVGSNKRSVTLTDILEHANLNKQDGYVHSSSNASETTADDSGSGQNSSKCELLCNNDEDDKTRSKEEVMTLCVEFNKNRWNYLAVGDSNGTIYIWQLNEKLFYENRDKQKLEQISDTFNTPL